MSVGLYLYQMTLLVKSLVDIHQMVHKDCPGSNVPTVF